MITKKYGEYDNFCDKKNKAINCDSLIKTVFRFKIKLLFLPSFL